jgi:succinate dehydrogenase/fumarate reductase flavoprotein subunit
MGTDQTRTCGLANKNARPVRYPEVLTPSLTATCDVLIVGGGLAATWAAVSAAEAGARVVLVDKGYCGASGVAATAGVGHWVVPPEYAARDQAMRVRARQGGLLTDRNWQERVLDETWQRLPKLAEWGYPDAKDARNLPVMRVGQAPHYLRFMRGKVHKLGVKILDHSPALELLTDANGEVAGARGYQLRHARTWEVRASAVVLATGGCTWKSKALGGDVNTGDGQLFAAEVGAELSGMEFSGFYGIVPRATSMDKNGYYRFATFTREDGSVIDGSLFDGRLPLLRASLEGPVHAQLDRAPREHWQVMRRAMPNFFMVMDKLRIDPFTQRFAVDFVLEGTVRGTGGVRTRDFDCGTGVPGLYVAGDVASRETIVGGATGAGAPNSAWAVASATWSGRAAARHAKAQGAGERAVSGAGRVGLRPSAGASLSTEEVQSVVQRELLPVEKNALRSQRGLNDSLRVLDALWKHAESRLFGTGRELVKAREAAAMLAMGRWAYQSALFRTESRAMHFRSDFPQPDVRQQHRILVGGLDEVWTRPDTLAPVIDDAWLAA